MIRATLAITTWSLTVGLCLLLSFQSLALEPRKVYLASLNWPPYSGERLYQSGITVQRAKEIFAQMGYELVVEFHPWSRTKALVEKGNRYIGYFPEYRYDTDDYVFSEEFDTSPLGIMENVDKPLEWEGVEDLCQYRIGVVQDYVNTTEIDQLIASGKLDVHASAKDADNLYLVAKGRLDGAIIDKNAMEYLIENDPRSAFLSKQLRMNQRLLVNKAVVIAFKNTSEGRRINELFNLSLVKMLNQHKDDTVLRAIPKK